MQNATRLGSGGVDRDPFHVLIWSRLMRCSLKRSNEFDGGCRLPNTRIKPAWNKRMAAPVTISGGPDGVSVFRGHDRRKQSIRPNSSMKLFAAVYDPIAIFMRNDSDPPVLNGFIMTTTV
jgi:hypothetical protein